MNAGTSDAHCQVKLEVTGSETKSNVKIIAIVNCGSLALANSIDIEQIGVVIPQ